MNGYLAKGSVVAALGGLLFGFDTAVIAGATEALLAEHGILVISDQPIESGS